MAASIDEYLVNLPETRREALERVRRVITKNLPKGFEETIEFGMPSWVVPLSRYPKTYNKRPVLLAALASQKNHMAVYLTGIYGDEALRAWFEEAYGATGKKMDVGQSCVRFKTLADLPLEVIGDAIGKLGVDALIEIVERAHPKPAAKKPAAKKPAAKKPAR